MLLSELFETKKKSSLIKKKLKVKRKRNRKHVKKVTDEGLISSAAEYAAGKILAKISSSGD